MTTVQVATESAMDGIQRSVPLLRISKTTANRAPSASPAVAQAILAAYLAYRYYPTIPLRDILFCALFPAYLMLTNRLRFFDNLVLRQRPESHSHGPPEFFSGSHSSWFQRYMIFAASVGLALPLATIVLAPSRRVAELAAPHLFLLWVQVICESAALFNPYVHRYIALLVPVGFSAYRLGSLAEWLAGSASLCRIALQNYDAVPIQYAWGLALSGLNILFWTYNLFVTLLLKVVPEYLADDRCEGPDVRVVRLPFVGAPPSHRKSP